MMSSGLLRVFVVTIVLIIIFFIFDRNESDRH
jgi:hypothetical protein